MKVALINPRGFCFGVRRALEMMDDIKNQNAYVLHEIVHNKNVMEGYVKKGFRFTESVSDIPAGSHVVISAHGIGQNIEDELKKNFVVSDTTCPFVKKIHYWVRQLAQKQIPIILIGKKNHAEVIGIKGQIEKYQNIFIVSNTDDIGLLPDFDSVGVATQTTLSLDDVREIVNRIKKKYKTVFFQNGVCQATQERQEAVKNAAREYEMIVVVGDEKSSNAHRLVEVARTNGSDSILVETVSDLKKYTFPKSVAITAAASAPESVVQEVYHYLINLNKNTG